MSRPEAPQTDGFSPDNLYQPLDTDGRVPEPIVEKTHVPPDDVVRLAKEGLERVAALNPSVRPGEHLGLDNWYGHKKIRPSGQQLYGENPKPAV